MKKGFLFIVAIFLIAWSILVVIVEPNTFINSFIAVIGFVVGVFSVWIATEID